MSDAWSVHKLLSRYRNCVDEYVNMGSFKCHLPKMTALAEELRQVPGISVKGPDVEGDMCFLQCIRDETFDLESVT